MDRFLSNHAEFLLKVCRNMTFGLRRESTSCNGAQSLRRSPKISSESCLNGIGVRARVSQRFFVLVSFRRNIRVCVVSSKMSVI